ncbi:MAG: hypothetical protein FWC34_06155 [Bacteroidetes bacterium]|nr:hypothetical protein [Bacteroidota bacterium]MCL2302977.1 hypothetical protein [Lentimicrobiaceae bacterium]
MKKIIFLLFFGAFFIGGYAQFDFQPVAVPWNTVGNTGTTNLNFLGTTDCKPLIFKTRNTERMRLSQNHSFLGIGLTDPQAPLHVHHQLDEMPCGEIIIVDGNGDSTSVRSTSMLGRKVLQLTTPETGFANHNGFSIFSSFTKDVTLRQQEQGKFFIEGPGGGFMISPEGYIGMGTALPKQKLHIVDGNVVISKTSAKAPGSTNGSILFGAEYNSNTIPVWGIEYLSSDDPVEGGYGLNFWKPHGGGQSLVNHALFLADNCNVGIGTNNPLAKLDVNGSLSADALTAQRVNITENLNVQDATIDRYLNAEELYASYARINLLSVDDLYATYANIDGYLDVEADIRVQNANIEGSLWAQNANIADRIFAKELCIGDEEALWDPDYSPLIKINAHHSNKAFVIKSWMFGEVFTVYGDGLVCTREIRVSLQPDCWPDFVFENDYELRPLNEVEQFIIENKHLPNVPSAAEVEANGINLGEMNAILLQKVEELTLYIIQMQKEIDELKQAKGGK